MDFFLFWLTMFIFGLKFKILKFKHPNIYWDYSLEAKQVRTTRTGESVVVTSSGGKTQINRISDLNITEAV